MPSALTNIETPGTGRTSTPTLRSWSVIGPGGQRAAALTDPGGRLSIRYRRLRPAPLVAEV
jgi:hypothetical protein